MPKPSLPPALNPADLRALFAIVGEPLVLLDDALHVLESNAAAQAHLDLDSEALKAWLRTAADALRAGRPAPDRPALTLLALAGSADKPARWLLHARIDVGRAELDAMVQDRERIFSQRERTVLDSVLVGIVTVGRGGIEWMNRSARRMFGADMDEFIGQPMSIVATPDPAHPFRQTHYLDALDEAQTETFECRLKARDGREFWVVGNAVVTGTPGERQLTYALLDIERRRQAEAQTLQAQASLSRVIEVAPLAISLHDARTLAIEQINQAAAALAGCADAGQLLGAGPEALFGPEQAEQVRIDMHRALRAGADSGAVTQREYRLEQQDQTHIWDARFLYLRGSGAPEGTPDQLLMVASDVTERRAAEEARLEAAISQRELLVREVHHRIKNNLQGVAGLLQQIAARRPEVAGVINEAVGQVSAIAQVYGLQVGSSGPLAVQRVVEAIVGSVQRMSGRRIATRIEDEAEAGALSRHWSLPEPESIPIALTLNELLTNAIKHSPDSEVQCVLSCNLNSVMVEITNPGRLPPDFNLAQVPGSVSGLGLVRALLPRRSALLSITQRGELVVCRVQLWPPSVALLDPPEAGSVARPPGGPRMNRAQ